MKLTRRQLLKGAAGGVAVGVGVTSVARAVIPPTRKLYFDKAKAKQYRPGKTLYDVQADKLYTWDTFENKWINTV